MQELKTHTEREYSGNMDPAQEYVIWLILFDKIAFSSSAAQKKNRLPNTQLLTSCVGQILPRSLQNTKYPNQKYSTRPTAIQTLTIVKAKSGTGLTFKCSPWAFSQ